jgi:hypothetical protein
VSSDAPFLPSLGCVLRHYYEFPPVWPDETYGRSVRLTSITSYHAAFQQRGSSALKDAIAAGLKGERVFEAPLLPIGAALFPEILPMTTIIRYMRSGPMEFRIAAVFASLFYVASDLSVEIAEQVILGTGDALVLRAMKEALDVRNRTSHGGPCARCNTHGVQEQTMCWGTPRAV